MRSLLVILVCLVALAAAAGAGVYLTAPNLPDGPIAAHHASEQSFGQIERGRYLTAVADCAACHTNPNGGQPFAGGRGIETPFGTVVASNITPDDETGIGSWTSTDVSNALRHGFGRNGHMLYPAMPYVYYTKMTDDDVDAIYAYLRTVTPVRNHVVSNQLPFPFDIRPGMRAWNALYFKPGPFQPDPNHDTQWNRGAYLVTGPGHCGACHTPKTALGGDKTDAAFQGSSLQAWFAPNITGDARRGLGNWSQAEVVDYLRTGHNMQAAASGPMAEEVALSSSRMSDGDLSAIAGYLKNLPGQNDNGTPVVANDPQMVAGKAIYVDSCAACHRLNGSGDAGLFPTLKGAAGVQSREATSLIRVLLDGAKSVATDAAPTGAAMPSYGWKLRDDQIAAVLTYIRNDWGNQASAVTAADVHAMRRQVSH